MNAQQCGALYRGKEQCTKEAVELVHDYLPLCANHRTRLLTNIRRTKDQAFRAGANSFIVSAVEMRRRKEAQRAAQAVYFIKAGRCIKIGFSSDPERRLKHIRSNSSGAAAPSGLNTARAKLLATEPGGRTRENELHKQFDHLRIAGEWFRIAPELLDYIESTKAMEVAA